MPAGRVIQYYSNVSMSNGHDGLTQLVMDSQKNVRADNRLYPSQLEPGQYLVFTNKARDKMKVLAANNVLAYVRLPKGERIDLRTIQYIPHAFTARGSVNYDEALKRVVEQAMAQKELRSRRTQSTTKDDSTRGDIENGQ